jgi:hypothetical protein
MIQIFRLVTKKFAKGGGVDRISDDKINEVLKHYMIAALWSSVDNDNEPFDANYSITDIDEASAASMRRDVVKFLVENKSELDSSMLNNEQIGHDFWLTRHHHGAGFWDRGLNSSIADKLTAAAQAFMESSLFAEDGKVKLENDWDAWGTDENDELKSGGVILIKPKHAHRDDVAKLSEYLDDNSWSYKRAKAPNSELDYFVVSTVGVHRDEVAEIKRWLENQMWDWSEMNKYTKQYAKGGSVEDDNKTMVLNQASGFEHHAKELEVVARKAKHIPAWVVAKSQRASTDLSDITHYLDGAKFSKGGTTQANWGIGDILKYKKTGGNVCVFGVDSERPVVKTFSCDNNGKPIGGLRDGIMYLWDYEWVNYEKIGHVDLERVTKEKGGKSYSYVVTGSDALDKYALPSLDARWRFFSDFAPEKLKKSHDRLEDKNFHKECAKLIADFFEKN